MPRTTIKKTSPSGILFSRKSTQEIRKRITKKATARSQFPTINIYPPITPLFIFPCPSKEALYISPFLTHPAKSLIWQGTWALPPTRGGRRKKEKTPSWRKEKEHSFQKREKETQYLSLSFDFSSLY